MTTAPTTPACKQTVNAVVIERAATGSEIDAALKEVMAAVDKYIALLPKKTDTDKPQIAPTLRHASPTCFRIGCNMMLDAGGYMPGKIPVVAVPARPEDLRRYARKRSVVAVLKALGLHSPNAEVSEPGAGRAESETGARPPGSLH